MTRHVHYDWPAIETRLRASLAGVFDTAAQRAQSNDQRVAVEAQRGMAECQIIAAKTLITLRNHGIDDHYIDAIMAHHCALMVRTMIRNAADSAFAGEVFARAMGGSDAPEAMETVLCEPVQGGRA